MEATTQPATRPTTGRPLAANLPVWVLAGAFLGILVGLLLGTRASVLHPLGVIYSMMLESVVYPYILSSLIGGLGGLMRARDAAGPCELGRLSVSLGRRFRHDLPPRTGHSATSATDRDRRI